MFLAPGAGLTERPLEGSDEPFRSLLQPSDDAPAGLRRFSGPSQQLRPRLMPRRASCPYPPFPRSPQEIPLVHPRPGKAARGLPRLPSKEDRPRDGVSRETCRLTPLVLRPIPSRLTVTNGSDRGQPTKPEDSVPAAEIPLPLPPRGGAPSLPIPAPPARVQVPRTPLQGPCSLGSI